MQKSVPKKSYNLGLEMVKSEQGTGLGVEVPNGIFEQRLIGEFSELRLQFRLVFRVARRIWQIRRIYEVICRIRQIPQILSQFTL